jgi:hypothetical protein
MHYTELLNFLRAVVSLLALPQDAGPNTVMAALAKLLEQSARCVLNVCLNKDEYAAACIS